MGILKAQEVILTYIKSDYLSRKMAHVKAPRLPNSTNKGVIVNSH